MYFCNLFQTLCLNRSNPAEPQIGSPGHPKGDHPSSASIKEFFDKLDSDPDWFPGKHSDAKRGPKRILRGAKRAAIVYAAKRLKSEGNEPTYSAVVAACPNAAQNPKTGEPVHKSLGYTVFRESCYDDDNDPDDTWGHRSRLTRSALDDTAKHRRWFLPSICWH